MADSPYAHLPTVPEHWDTEDWNYVFGPAKYWEAPEWRAATPPPKEDVEPIGPEDVAEVTNIWSLSRQEYADQAMQARNAYRAWQAALIEGEA